MPGISQGLMMGVLTAQNNIGLAKQNQATANQRYLAGRVRERQGITDGNPDAIKEGQEMQAEGKEMELGTFEHLSNAMYSINYVSNESEDSYDETDNETGQEISNSEQAGGEADGEFNVVIRGDAIRGSVNRTVTAPRQNSVDISV
ncbi:MAG: hypothetical protein FWB80_04815 [Defluviitaleaceae bacterium]|nr:hypothetical protein [Defluviitaleaceae bacterium]